MFDPTCHNVLINEGTDTQMSIDGSAPLENAFDIIRNITIYANNMLIKAIWDPNFALGNRQRVLDLLVNFGLPQEHPNFHDMVNALLGLLLGTRNSFEWLMTVISSILSLRSSIESWG